MSFENLGLAGPALAGIRAAGFTNPTPIQQKAIPAALEGRDLIGSAKTGSGKTAAFLLPILQRLAGTRNRALVLAPTRELAQQIEEVALTLGRPSGLAVVTVVGGIPLERDFKRLENPWQLLIATPGRLIDHLRQFTIRIDLVRHLVLDEADRMLDMGFMPQIREILRHLPSERQTLLFSATIPPDLSALMDANMKEPVLIEVDRRSTANEKIDQEALVIDAKEKDLWLKRLIDREPGRMLVFTRTKGRADRVAFTLARWKVRVARIHSDRTQSQRNNALDGFRTGRYQVLVATDVASRGIDVDNIMHIVNYDIPHHPEDYIHRIGRTARGEGVCGKATTFVDTTDAAYLRDIEKLLGLPIPRSPDSAAALQEPESRNRRRGAGKGPKPSATSAQGSSPASHPPKSHVPMPQGAKTASADGRKRRRRRRRGGHGATPPAPPAN